MITFDDVLEVFGYIPEDDSWETDGRRTYINHDSASRGFIRVLIAALARHGWKPDKARLRTLVHSDGNIIEIEPGGPDTSGHYLHHMKAEVVA